MVSFSKILVSLLAICDVSLADADIPGMNRRLLHIHPPPTAMPTPGPIPSYPPTNIPGYVSPAPISHVVVLSNTTPSPVTPNTPAPSTPVVVGPAPTEPLQPDLVTEPPVLVPSTAVPVVPIPTDITVPTPTKPVDVNTAPTWPLGIATPQPSGSSVTPSPVTPLTPAPVTAAPVTAAPVTAAPVTAAPVTAAPVTPSPSDTVSVPIGPVVVTPSPTITITTAAPVTAAPVTATPTTPSPTIDPKTACAVQYIMEGPCPCTHTICFTERDPAANCQCQCPAAKLKMAAWNDPATCGSQKGLEWSAVGCGCDLFHIPAPRIPTNPPTTSQPSVVPTRAPSKVPTTAMPSQIPTTAAPTVPTTAAPVTAAPVIAVPLTPSPVTPAPSDTVSVPIGPVVVTPSPLIVITTLPPSPTVAPSFPIWRSPTSVPSPTFPIWKSPSTPPSNPPPPTPQPTMPRPPHGHVMGAFGQFCKDPVSGSVQCATTTAVMTDMVTPGEISCGRPNDCCLCSSISCGSPTSLSCEQVEFGENAAFGVHAVSIYGEVAGADIECFGRTSCAYSMIHAENIKLLSCVGQYGCQNAKITIRNPVPNFNLICGVTGACQGMELELIYTPPPGISQSECDRTAMQKVEMGSLQCIGVGACIDMKLSVRNLGCDRIEMMSLECREGSCGGAQFEFEGAVDILNCELAAAGSQPLGLDKCYMNLRALICPDIGSCMNEQRTITDPANGFQILCQREHSCRSASYTIALTSAPREIPVEFMHIECTEVNSCMGSSFAISNGQIDATSVPLEAVLVKVKVECIGQNACTGANFAVGDHVEMDLVCGDLRFCEMCFNNGVPCHPDAIATANVQHQQAQI